MAKEEVLEKNDELEETPKKKPKMILIVIIVVAISILGVLGFLFKDSLLLMFNKAETGEEVVEELPEFTYPFDSMAIRLSDENKNAYLKVSIALKYRGEENLTLIEEKKLDIQARVNEVLRTKKSSELKTIEQTDVLKEELKKEINNILEDELVFDIIFPDFITQY